MFDQSKELIINLNPITRAAAHASCSESVNQKKTQFASGFSWSLLTRVVFFCVKLRREVSPVRVLCGSCAGPVRAVSGLLVGLSDLLLDGNNKAASVRTEAEDGQAAGGVSSGPHHVADKGINESSALV